MDRSEEIAREIVDILEWDQEDGKLQPAASIRLILHRADTLEIMAAAHDAEDSAQKGEPSPWRKDLMREYEAEHGIASMNGWKAERRAAMLCALKAVGLA